MGVRASVFALPHDMPQCLLVVKCSDVVTTSLESACKVGHGDGKGFFSISDRPLG
jgi:hypothetical protein